MDNRKFNEADVHLPCAQHAETDHYKKLPVRRLSTSMIDLSTQECEPMHLRAREREETQTKQYEKDIQDISGTKDNALDETDESLKSLLSQDSALNTHLNPDGELQLLLKFLFCSMNVYIYQFACTCIYLCTYVCYNTTSNICMHVCMHMCMHMNIFT